MSAPSTPPPRTTSLSYNNAFASTSYSTPRPNSPSPSSDFSIIGADEAETNDQADYSFWSYNTSTPYKGFGSLGRRAAIYSTPTLNYFASSVPFPSSSAPQAGTSSSLKSLFPRIWDVLISSPTKNIISTSRSPITSQTFTPLDSDIHRHSMFPSYAPRSHSPTPVNRLTKGKGRANRNYSDQGESVDYLPARHSISSQYSYINFSDLPPLDGEEGELIDVDDEACFLPADHFRYGGTTWRGGVKGSFSRARVVTGIDILSMLPTEVALHVLEFLASGCSYNPHVCPSRNSSFRASRIPPNPYLQETFLTPEQSLQNILICSLVSKTWRSLALDNSVWRTMFECKWGNGESGGGITKDPAAIRRYLSNRTKSMTTGRDKRLPALPDDIGSSIQSSSALEVLSLNYFKLYQERLELDRRWAGTAFTKRVSAASAYSPSSSNLNLSPPASRSSSLTPMYAAEYAPSSTMTSSRSSLSASTMMGTLESRRSQPMPELPSMLSEHWDKWEPDVMKLSGHSDSVYCIELPSSTTYAADKFFVTGSRDRTIKMWSAKTGKCIGTFGQRKTQTAVAVQESQDAEVVDGHEGSVLCLKFIWDEGVDDSVEEDDGEQFDAEDEGEDVVVRKGIMFSGSSDRTICVWVVRMTVSNQGQYKVDARVRTVLRGHTGGVLDLRVDDNWIVSCSKDTTIRVWNRKTLTPHRTLRGHEGPVNAVGMEDGRVVSASGDGKMILWDASSGERLRTFEGHDRGLACIEYSNGLIISGSNDWKIKIWSAYTGKCLRTLQGHEALVRALAFDPASGLLVSSSYDKSVRVWDIKDVLNRNGGENTTRTPEMENKSLLRVFRNAHTSHIFDVKFDVGRIVSTSHDQKIVVADFSSGLENGHLFL